MDRRVATALLYLLYHYRGSYRSCYPSDNRCASSSSRSSDRRIVTLGRASVTDAAEVSVRVTGLLTRPTLPSKPMPAVMGNVDITTPPTGTMLACGFTTGFARRAGSKATKQSPTDTAFRAEAEFATQANAKVAVLSPVVGNCKI